ncbi:MAG TPA: ECF-type sigma factor [Phycisphaerales bacterium]|nr:ECF-type sigma factor [Phycisphaerales bacterium]
MIPRGGCVLTFEARNPPPDNPVTRLLTRATAGDAAATDELFPVVYGELHRMASALMSRERGPGPHTLQPTALVHEVYLRLIGPGDISWQNKAHFFGAAAIAMRRILIDRARRVKAGRSKTSLDEGTTLPTLDSASPPARAAEDLIALDDAMGSLRSRDARQHDVVMLRFFAGLTLEQTASSLGVSLATVKSDWSYARAWLLREVERRRAPEGKP